MSPTSYQTAPPREFILAKSSVSVKRARFGVACDRLLSPLTDTQKQIPSIARENGSQRKKCAVHDLVMTDAARKGLISQAMALCSSLRAEKTHRKEPKVGHASAEPPSFGARHIVGSSVTPIIGFAR